MLSKSQSNKTVPPSKNQLVIIAVALAWLALSLHQNTPLYGSLSLSLCSLSLLSSEAQFPWPNCYRRINFYYSFYPPWIGHLFAPWSPNFGAGSADWSVICLVDWWLRRRRLGPEARRSKRTASSSRKASMSSSLISSIPKAMFSHDALSMKRSVFALAIQINRYTRWFVPLFGCWETMGKLKKKELLELWMQCFFA